MKLLEDQGGIACQGERNLLNPHHLQNIFGHRNIYLSFCHINICILLPQKYIFLDTKKYFTVMEVLQGSGGGSACQGERKLLTSCIIFKIIPSIILMSFRCSLYHVILLIPLSPLKKLHPSSKAFNCLKVWNMIAATNYFMNCQKRVHLRGGQEILAKVLAGFIEFG